MLKVSNPSSDSFRLLNCMDGGPCAPIEKKIQAHELYENVRHPQKTLKWAQTCKIKKVVHMQHTQTHTSVGGFEEVTTISCLRFRDLLNEYQMCLCVTSTPTYVRAYDRKHTRHKITTVFQHKNKRKYYSWSNEEVTNLWWFYESLAIGWHSTLLRCGCHAIHAV